MSIVNEDHGITILNRQAVYEKQRDPFFRRVETPQSNVVVLPISSRSVRGGIQAGNSYISPDPRLYHAARYQTLALDTIPVTSSVQETEVYTDLLDNHGGLYGNLSNIRAGHVVYYINDYFNTPLIPVNYSNTNREIDESLYKDPMDDVHPVYRRVNEPVGNWDGKRSTSFLRDTMEHREDLMNLQSRKRLRSDPTLSGRI